MEMFMEQAKVMAKGQITLPLEIRKLLGVSTGDRISFIVNGNTVIMANSAACALTLIQNALYHSIQALALLSPTGKITVKFVWAFAIVNLLFPFRH